MPDAPDEGERLAANADVHANAWQETLDEMWELEDELDEEGWDAIATAAGHTGPVAPSHGKEYWGLVHIVPDSDGEAIEELVEDGEFTVYDVFRNMVEGRVFGVTVFYDPDGERAILVASQFQLRQAQGLIEHTHDVGHVNSVIRYLDGTVVAEVRHDDPGKFFPRYETFAPEE